MVLMYLSVIAAALLLLCVLLQIQEDSCNLVATFLINPEYIPILRQML